MCAHISRRKVPKSVQMAESDGDKNESAWSLSQRVQSLPHWHLVNMNFKILCGKKNDNFLIDEKYGDVDYNIGIIIPITKYIGIIGNLWLIIPMYLFHS